MKDVNDILDRIAFLTHGVLSDDVYLALGTLVREAYQLGVIDGQSEPRGCGGDCTCEDP